MNKKVLLLVTVVLIAVLVAASVFYNSLSSRVENPGLATQPARESQATQPAVADPAETVPQTTAPDYAAPDFTVLDWEGNERKLSEFEGKPTILNFWASWCGPCKSEMPDFQAAYEAYGDRINFVMVNCTGGRETVESAKEFIEQEGYTFPVYFDTSYEAASVYGASSIPMTFFIDAEGNLITYGMGALPAELLQKGIDMIYTEE